MPEASERGIVTDDQPPDAATRLGHAGSDAAHFVLALQTAMFQEMLFAGYEMVERARSETHLLAEFASKIASAHSIGNIQAMWTECSRHQLDFVRRDCERLLRHGEETIEATSKLFGNLPRN